MPRKAKYVYSCGCKKLTLSKLPNISNYSTVRRGVMERSSECSRCGRVPRIVRKD